MEEKVEGGGVVKELLTGGESIRKGGVKGVSAESGSPSGTARSEEEEAIRRRTRAGKGREGI